MANLPTLVKQRLLLLEQMTKISNPDARIVRKLQHN
jgi:hypothetical protein